MTDEKANWRWRQWYLRNQKREQERKRKYYHDKKAKCLENRLENCTGEK